MPSGRRTVVLPSSSTCLKEESVLSPSESIQSPAGRGDSSGSDESTMDRKKATHLRCERQRREAINNGYNDLKDLLPPSMTAVGCKTTNAAILFRACDFMKQLNSEGDAAEKELSHLQSELSALRMIAQQYETMAADAPLTANASPQAKMLQVLMDECFTSFSEDVDCSSYQSICRSMLQWIETLENDTQGIVSKMTAVPFKKARR